MLDYQSRVRGLRLGYTPGVIRHYFHGSKQNRRYTERWKILIQHAYSPITHVRYEDGFMVANISQSFADDILNYFKERREDD